MIDYQKLKVAHELAEKYALENETATSLSLTTRFVGQALSEYQAEFCGIEAYEEIGPCSLSELIEKLTELTTPKPEPKLQVGQQVWIIHPNKKHPWVDEVVDILQQDDGVYYAVQSFVFEEAEVYPTREALIESQIAHWTSMREPKKEKTYSQKLRDYVDGKYECEHESDGDTDGGTKGCEHESDGDSYINISNLSQDSYKCKHCGEFYK